MSKTPKKRREPPDYAMMALVGIVMLAAVGLSLLLFAASQHAPPVVIDGKSYRIIDGRLYPCEPPPRRVP